MAYECPRCGGSVSRSGYRGMSHQNVPNPDGGLWVADLIGSFFYAVFGAFKCNNCGKIPRNEFPSDVRVRMAMGTLLIIVVSLCFVLGVAGVLFYLNNSP